MPPPYVRTIHDEINYEYAKLISRSALKKIVYPFVTDRFKKLRDGAITMSGTIREWQLEQKLPHQCVWCESTDNLTTDHLVPVSRGGSDSGDNVVQACGHCNSARGKRGVFEWLGISGKDKLHHLVAGKYLKELLSLHEQHGTLGIAKAELPQQLCPNCQLTEVCRKEGLEGELTCYCLESILAKRIQA